MFYYEVLVRSAPGFEHVLEDICNYVEGLFVGESRGHRAISPRPGSPGQQHESLRLSAFCQLWSLSLESESQGGRKYRFTRVPDGLKTFVL
jgi:hypothetical protein